MAEQFWAPIQRTGNDEKADGGSLLKGDEPTFVPNIQLPDNFNWPQPAPSLPKSGLLDSLSLLKGMKGDLSSSPKADRPLENPVRNGLLELKYGEPDFDRKLSAGFPFNQLRITDMPPDVKLRHWIDERGYFFWFQNGNDNRSAHHYPHGLKTIEIDGQRQDVDLERIQVSEAFMAQHNRMPSGFSSIDKRTDVLSYFRNMSEVSQQALTLQEKVLRESAQNSQNPYFRIYLSDVLVTQAMQPIIKGVLSGGTVNFDNPETVRKLDDALAQLREAQRLSSDSLYHQNRLPPGNVVMPLAPYSYHYDPYSFWGGSLYQAQRREVALTWIRALITSGALRNIELPPALPPK